MHIQLVAAVRPTNDKQPLVMRSQLLDLLNVHDGVLTRAQAMTVVSNDVLDRAVAAGVVIRVYPEVFVDASYMDDRHVRRRAALIYLPEGAISHIDALAEWGAAPDADDSAIQPVHVTVGADSSQGRVPGLAKHRRQGFRVGPPHTVTRKGLELVRLEQAVIESWPLLPPMHRRAPAIEVVRQRRTTPARLSAVLEQQPKTSGAAQMRALIASLAEGCHSEFEIWGHEHVFTHSSMPPSQGQRRVEVGRRVFSIDRAFVKEMVGVEMDGAAYHSATDQREWDVHRDALLARLGWLILRFTHRRLHGDPDGVRNEIREVLLMRRRQLGLRPA